MTMAAMIVPLLVFCGKWFAYAAVNCRETGRGRFADPDDKTCKNYTLCIYVHNADTYITYNAVCPSVSVFNPKTSKCTSPTMYTCNEKTVATIKPTVTTKHKPPEICSYDGYIADPDSLNCETYIQCVNISGGFTQLRQICPVSTHFNPNTTLCETNYKCGNFTCPSAGRIADKSDITCHKYYYCVHLYNGSYAKFDYSCPGDLMFNPMTKVCTTNYECS